MNQAPASTGRNPSDRLAAWYDKATLPSWLISLMLHALALGVLATLTWTVKRAVPETRFSVGIVLKKDTPQGVVFQDQHHTRQPQAQRPQPDFVPVDAPSELELPQLPPVDMSTIGVARSTLSGLGQMFSVPDAAAGTPQMASTDFFGAHVQGNKFVYVIDRSGSMSQRDALQAAKRELLASLRKLPVTSQFQIIFYNFSPAMIPSGGPARRLLPATQTNKTRARQFLETIDAVGSTEHLLALEAALKLQPEVIFFLTDADDMRQRDVRSVTELNRGRARIHTIEFGLGQDLEQETTLRQLAEANGGTYRYIDTTRLGSVDPLSR